VRYLDMEVDEAIEIAMGGRPTSRAMVGMEVSSRNWVEGNTGRLAWKVDAPAGTSAIG
jgi:hypothetical protein